MFVPREKVAGVGKRMLRLRERCPLALGNTRLLLGRNNLIGIDVILMSHPCYLIANHDSSLHCKRLIIRVDSRKVKGGVKRK